MQVEPQEWITLSRLLDEALDVSLDARDHWLETLPPAHTPYKEKLRALLRHDVGSETRAFRNIFPSITMADREPAVLHRTAGTRIGPYVLEEEIGRGGMGEVWRARRHDGFLKRVVALKLPHTELYGPELKARFESERDILAELIHPNIARLYDAGVSGTGQPYLAIEYIAGSPLLEYCDRQRLDIPQRLRVFQQLLSAVSYAHGNLVIHRDLKPTNVIVGADGRAMLLDFGIAQLVGADDAEPQISLPCPGLTPEYAAPEQLVGQGFTAAADIYSLGVLLLELLIGERASGKPQLPSERVGCPSRAATRSTTARALWRELRGDLDAIVLKAMRKDPNERYPTVEAFTRDIEHYLRGDVVEARYSSGWYRALKFVRRQAVSFAMGGGERVPVV